MINMPRKLSVSEYAAQAGRSNTTVYRWIRQGMTLPGALRVERTNPIEAMCARYRIVMDDQDGQR